MTGDVTARVRAFFDRAAVGWERWSIGMHRDDTHRYLEAAAVAPGDRLLEVGAGAGEQTLALAERVGPDGRVVATDLSAEMLDIAARRIGDAGFGNVEFIVSGVDELEFDDGTFDVCVSGFTWEFLADPVGAAERVVRLLAPGGRFAASAWASGDEVPFRAIVGSTVLAELGMQRPAPEGGPTLADPREFERVLTEAGLSEVSIADLPVTMRWESPSAYAQSMRELAPQLQDLIDARAPDRTGKIWEAVADAVADHVAEDGMVVLVNQAYLGYGIRSG